MKKMRELIHELSKVTLPIFCLLLILLSVNLVESLDQSNSLLEFSLYRLKKSENEVSDAIQDLTLRLFPGEDYLGERYLEYGSFDSVTYSIPIKLTFIPDNFYHENTVAVLRCNEEEISMSFDGTAFYAEFTASVFQRQIISDITFINNDLEKREHLFWIIEPIDQLAPQFYVYALGETVQGEAEIKYSKTVHLYLLKVADQCGKIKELNVMEAVDGTPLKKTSMNPPLPKPFNHTKSFSLQKDIRGSISKDSNIKLIVEIVDEYGLHYQKVAWEQSADDAAITGKEHSIFDQSVTIFDGNGNLVYVLK